ncbi:MAG: hypothetical protein ACRC6U_00855 [Fusobacteriaceae bacterium]
MAKIADDKYYTPKAVVKKVIELLEKDLMPIEQFSRIIEPSAGAGAFLRELPKSAVGYDILPEFEGIIKGDYLQQEIPYLKNSLVIGNPPFGVSGGLVQKFIKKSFEHSDYVAFVIPVDNYNKQTKIKGVELYKSYKLPEVKYSGVSLKCCINIYKRGETKIKKVNGVDIVKFSRIKATTKKEEQAFIDLEADFRMIAYGGVRIVEVHDKKTRATEYKIIFDKKRNFKPILEAFLDKKLKESVTIGRVSIQDIINLIYDSYEDLRAN